jgi:lactoylglutathione lyase
VTLESLSFRLTHVRLLVKDVSGAFRFWRDVVGLEPTYGDGSGRYADFDTGPANLAIFEARAQDESVGAPPRGAQRGADQAAVIIEVADVDAAVRTLEARGVRFLSGPTDHVDWGIRAAHFRDPEGNLVELYRSMGELS